MKVKLNHSQMMALASVFQKFLDVDDVKPTEPQARLLFFLLNATFKQVQKKLIDRKKKYSLTLTEPEACAFVIFFSKYDIRENDVTETIYKGTLVNNISGAIHKFFSDN